MEVIETLCGWTLEEKTQQLTVAPQGDAHMVLLNLAEEERGNLNAMTAALQRRFGSVGDRELLQARFRQRHEVWVADIQDPCILGLDFLQWSRGRLDLAKGMVQFGDSPALQLEIPVGVRAVLSLGRVDEGDRSEPFLRL
ncbi:UNVERIFIED_CONTAM: hypothetical protein FKN15_039723 [Acipenser sinensis]